MKTELLFNISFWLIFILGFAIDFRVTGKKNFHITFKKAVGWTLFWITSALLYCAAIYFFYPQNSDSTYPTAQLMSLKFIAGYITEYSLSVDNLFVFILIFTSMHVAEERQVKLLKLGILISIALRILFIVVGMELVNHFHWMFYIFGSILIYTAVRMLYEKEDNTPKDPAHNIVCRVVSKIVPVDVHTRHFFSRKDNRFHLGYPFLALLVVGSTDVMFATDSIPAIIGVIHEGSANILSQSQNNFLAISSNAFAVMGLTCLFFMIKSIIAKFRYIRTAVFFILFFIGIKMLLFDFQPFAQWVEKRQWFSFVVIITTLVIAVVASVWKGNEENEKN